MREVPAWAGVIHRRRKLLRQNLRKLVDRNIEARRKLLHLIAAQHLLQFVGGNRNVLPAADLTKIMSAVTTPTQPIEELLPEDRVPTLFPDLPLNETLAHFYRWPLLPIVDRAVCGLLEGTATQTDVLRCYERNAHGYK